jgi:hypothetical protein
MRRSQQSERAVPAQQPRFLLAKTKLMSEKRPGRAAGGAQPAGRFSN